MSADQSPQRSRTFTWSDPEVVAGATRNLSGLPLAQAWAAGDVPQPPICALMNFRLAEVGEGRAVFTAVPDEYHLNAIGTVHGGLAATLIDSATGLAVMSALAEGTAWTTLDLNVTFVRAMTKDTGPIRCEAWLVHKGSRVVTAEARVSDEAGRLYAHGAATCLVLGSGGRRAPSDNV